jgi:5-methylcytosine-specific restriction endonuclease McrA
MKLPVHYGSSTPQKRRLVRKMYIRIQDGRCHYCSNPLEGPPTEMVLKKVVDRRLFPPNFFQWPVHLHHDHKTGMTVGVVHAYCNAILWVYHGE